MYLRLGKIWSPEYTWDLSGHSYLFSHPKYKAWHVPETWSVAGTCFSTQNIKPGRYLRPGRLQVPVFPPKLGSLAGAWCWNRSEKSLESRRTNWKFVGICGNCMEAHRRSWNLVEIFGLCDQLPSCMTWRCLETSRILCFSSPARVYKGS